MKFIQLDIAAIKQSDSQNNAYVLILNEVTGKRQLPIVIGWCEARSIAIALEGSSQPNRPLTHDLFKNIGDKFDLTVQKIVIHTLIEGIFHASFYCKNNSTGQEEAIDARTSDAIAIALRYKCPIFTYEDILARAGIILNTSNQKDGSVKFKEKKVEKSQKIAAFSIKKLKKLLTIAIDDEDYEKASKIRDEIKKREKNK